MVGSLSGTMEGVYVAKEAIRLWNLENAEREGRLYLPVEWSSRFEYLFQVDMLICIVGDWVEKTDVLEDSLKEGKDVLLLFNAFHNPDNTILSEQIVVEQLQSVMETRYSCEMYNGMEDFRRIINNRLSML